MQHFGSRRTCPFTHLIVVITLLCSTIACIGLAAQPTRQVEPPIGSDVPLIPSVAVAATSVPTASPSPIQTPLTIQGLSEIAYQLPLTTQYLNQTEAVLFFKLAQPSAGIVIVNPTDSPAQQQVFPLNESEMRQQITLSNLNPGTSYQVSIGLGSDMAQLAEPTYTDRAWGPVEFRTPSGADPLRIGVIGDSGFGDDTTYQLASAMASQNLDFVIHTGDTVYQIYNNKSAVEAFAQKWYLPLEPLLKRMPIYPAVGNHDVEDSAKVDGTPFYYLAFPPFTANSIPPSDFQGHRQWYAFEINGWQFVMLDTQTFFGEPGQAEQDTWLKERLADPAYQQHTVVVFHVPPFSSGKVHQGDGYPVREWASLFEDAKVPLVLNGHSHDYERLKVGSVTYVISGGGSASLYGQGEIDPSSQIFATRSHFVVLEVQEDRIDLQAIDVKGEILDTATITLPR